jgi:hypothetical protein
LPCAVKRDAKLRICLRRNRWMASDAGVDRLRRRGSKRGKQQNRWSRRCVRAFFFDRAGPLCRACPLSQVFARQRAMMPAVPPAAGGQSRLCRSRPEHGRDKRQAENQHQRYGQCASHSHIVARLRYTRYQQLAVCIIPVARLHVKVLLVHRQFDLVISAVAALFIRRVAQDVLAA